MTPQDALTVRAMAAAERIGARIARARAAAMADAVRSAFPALSTTVEDRNLIISGRGLASLRQADVRLRFIGRAGA